MVNSVRAVIDRKHRFVAALFVFMELLDFLSRSGMEVTMKKREFQKKVTAQLFKKLVEVCAAPVLAQDGEPGLVEEFRFVTFCDGLLGKCGPALR